MNVSSINEVSGSLRKNLFIKYANSFMSNPETNTIDASEKAIKANPETDNSDKPKGIETLTEFSIFPKQVINGKTIITA